MKNLKFTLFICSALIYFGACQNASVAQEKERKSHHTISINNDKNNYSISYDGEITLSEDERSVLRISNLGYLKLKRNGVEVLVENDNQGNLVYSFTRGEKGTTAEAKAWLESNIRLLINAGVGAKERVARLYKKGGVNAVLDGMEGINSDFVQKIYFDYLLKKTELSDNELLTVADKISTVIESDFEMSNLLVGNADRFFKNPQVTEAYLKALNKMDSDFEKAKVLKTVLNGELKLNENQFNRLVQVAATKIDSDFEKANVLKKVLDKPLTDSQFQTAMDGVSSINSDFEAANILKKALNLRELTEKQISQTIAIVKNIDSDFEKANVLKTALQRNQPSDNQVIEILNNVKTIDSDFEKSNVMLKLSEKMPKNNENLRAKYLEVAKTINSDFEYGKVMRAMD
jgi:hypothetical protein